MSFVNVRLRNRGGGRILKRRSTRTMKGLRKRKKKKHKNLTEEEKYEYFMIKKLQKIWNKVKL